MRGDVSHGGLLSGRGRTRTCSLARSNSPYTSFFQSQTLSTSTCCLPHSRGRQRPGKDGGKGQEEGGQESRTSNVLRCRCRQPRAPRLSRILTAAAGPGSQLWPENSGAVCGHPPPPVAARAPPARPTCARLGCLRAQVLLCLPRPGHGASHTVGAR